MKKVVLLLVMFSAIMLTSCTDNSLEELEKKNEAQKSFIEKDKLGDGDDDDEETGEE